MKTYKKYAVVKNVLGKVIIHRTNLSFIEGVEVCQVVTDESHGGDAWVVEAETAEKVRGVQVEDARFIWFTVSGEARLH